MNGSQPSSDPPQAPKLSMDVSALPVSHIESLKFKVSQIHSSTIEMGGMPYMLPWPEILTKYNLLISQTTNLQVALQTLSGPTSETPNSLMFEHLALHPGSSMSDFELDTQLIPLLRTQQTNDVLTEENANVRRIAERLPHTRGSVGMLHEGGLAAQKEWSEVIEECATIRTAHDSLVNRAQLAVKLLKDNYTWKNWTSIVEEAEPEELPDQDVQMGAALDEDLEALFEGEGDNQTEGGSTPRDSGSSGPGTPLATVPTDTT
ncbi:hypothetical protein DL96DRAFT_1467024 [Flagelloscypha sp. PMI_526]|nr:hypothetical protein DL96DRAFT_1467024 [Flagelloscypha sp. PMI_526]